MMEFTVSGLRTNTVAYVARMRGVIQLDPIYQRQGEVWSRNKQRLLIDSIINQFDIPKIYFHQHAAPVIVGTSSFKYSLVDGRQRLEAIWDFIDGKFALADDFVLLSDESTSAAGKNYAELQAEEGDIAGLFDASPLDIMVIQTSDIELIEEMFSRLNEAVPLNAAEKRNGRGGPLRPIVRDLCGHDLFTSRLPFGNTRFRHLDLATKFLLLDQERGPADVKKRQLDDFWERFRDSGDEAAAIALGAEVKRVLDQMVSTFGADDTLLSAVGMVSTYYLYYREVVAGNRPKPLRADLVRFEKSRKLNRFNDEEDLSRQQRRLLEFDRLSQSPNDGSALKFRVDLLGDFLADPSSFE